MKTLSKNNKIIDFIEYLFLYLFLAYSIFGTNSFTYGTKVISVIMWPTFLLGFLILAYRVINFKCYFKDKSVIFFVFMLGSIGLSTLLNYQYSFKANLIFCIYWAFYFLIICTIESSRSIEKVKSDIEHVAAFFSTYISISVLTSIFLLLIHYSAKMKAPDTGYEYYAGFVIGRLWGTFINPNSGAVSAAVSSVIMLYFLLKSKKIAIKILCGLDIFFLLMYIALSDSRSGAVCSAIAFGTFAFFELVRRTKDKKTGVRVLAVMLALVIFAVGYFTPRKLKDGYNGVSNMVAEYVAEHSDGTEGKDDGFKLSQIDRGYDLSGDVSNRRFDVWKSGVEVYLSSAKVMLVGVSFNGIRDYATEFLPDTYIISSDFGAMTTLDNEIINIMVAQGAIGLLSVAAFVLFVLIRIMKRIFTASKEYALIVSLLIASVFGFAAPAMFGSVMFYHFSPNAIMFWAMLGSLMFILKNDKKAEVKTNEQQN